jgi:hypothetical protein
VDGYGDAFLGQTLQLTLTVAELVDLIEIGAIAEHESGWSWEILTELRTQFTELVQDINEAADEI